MFRQCLGPRQLEEIDRTGQGINRFPEDLHRHRKRLQTLILDGNALREIPAIIGNFNKLQKLSISNNELEHLPDAIARLTHLQELNVSHNTGLVEVPQEVQSCKNLEVLDISATAVQALPDSMTQISTLTHLTINDSELKRLPSDLSGLSNLRVLEARENMLKFLPVSIASLKRLQRLDLGSNEIEQLPRTIGCLVCLEELALDENGLTELPPELNGFAALRELDISKNALVKLPTEFCELKSLTDLYMSENCLTELPEEIGQLTSLQLLKVDGNQLTSVPESIEKLTELRELVLSDNAIDTLPTGIGRLRKLESLHADKNHLSAIPYQLGDCTALHILTLRDNQLTDVPRSIGQLTSLRVLDLACNQIQRLPYSLAELKLKALWLSERQSKSLPNLEKAIDTDSGDVFAACDLLPQHPRETDSELEDEQNNRKPIDPDEERHVAFAPDPNKPESVPPIVGEKANVLMRQKTPYRNELKEIKEVARKKHMEEKRASVASRSLSVSPDLPREPAEASFVRNPGVSLGFSVAGGTGVDQPFRDDDDQGVFITKIKDGGLAEESKQFKLWDKILKVNDFTFEGISHDEAVQFLKTAHGKLQFQLMREIEPKEGEHSAAVSAVPGAMVSGPADSDASMVIHDDPPPPKVESSAAVAAAVATAATAKDDDAQGHEKHEDEGMEEESKLTMSKEAEATLGDLDKHLDDSIADNKKEEIVDNTEEEVILHRVNRSLGMSIVGGNDSSSLPFAPAGSADVFISKVVTSGAADRSGRLRMGDRIIKVDGLTLSTQSHNFAVAALVNSGDVVKMKVFHHTQPAGLVPVELHRNPEERLGLSIKGGVDSRPGNPIDKDDEGIFVSKIREQSAASRCPELRIGQRLVEVNGQTLLGATHFDAVALLKEATSPVRLLLCDGYDENLARSVSPADSLRESLSHISPPSPSKPEELPSPPEMANGGPVMSSQEMLPPPPDSSSGDDVIEQQSEADMPSPPAVADSSDVPAESGEDLPPPPMED
ncbi:protein scribble homolog isoform X1 [Sycon ciliatum]|uniref:protein scribble homolog isoform X1 n=1 Tax=Sycon ciliatum TaxID=27933 RepID=UPI0031F6692E